MARHSARACGEFDSHGTGGGVCPETGFDEDQDMHPACCEKGGDEKTRVQRPVVYMTHHVGVTSASVPCRVPACQTPSPNVLHPDRHSIFRSVPSSNVASKRRGAGKCCASGGFGRCRCVEFNPRMRS